MKTLLLALAMALVTNLIYAQGFEPSRKIKYLKLPNTSSLQSRRGLNFLFNTDKPSASTDSLLGSGAEFFQQIGVNVTNAMPKVNIKAVKLYAKVGKKAFIDFYVLSSVPLATTNPTDSVKNLGTELQNLYGGLINTYFSKTWYFNKETDFQTRGLQFDLKGGYKLSESSKENGAKSVYLSSGQLAGELRFLVPLFGDPTDTDLAGLVQLKACGQALYTSSDDYNNYFRSSDGKEPSRFLFSYNFEGSVHVFNEFYVSGGYSMSSVNTIDDFAYFKLTYSRK